MRSRTALVLGVLLLLLSGAPGCGPGPAGTAGGVGRRTVRVAAAADLRWAFSDLSEAFQRQHPDVPVEVSYGSSGEFFAQLQNQAPYDVFLSADVDYPRRLVDADLADRDSLFLYAIGHLVVWVPKSSGLDVEKRGIEVLLDPAVKKIALANPAHAPYGRAAEAALKSLKVYDKVKDRLVYGANVSQTAQFVQSGSADVGLIALSLALAPNLRDEGRFWEVPLDAYPRLEQGGVILSWAQDKEAAGALRAFVVGDEGQAILRRYGFHPPEGRREEKNNATAR